MLLRFIVVATLTVGVFGRSTFNSFPDNYDPVDEYSQLVATEYCKATHAEDKTAEVKASIKTFAKCMTNLFDTETVSKEIREATKTGSYDTIIMKYCSKAPQLKDCARDLVTGVTPCLPPGMAGTSIHSTNALIDFVCDNQGARVTSFVKEGGPQCAQNKQFELARCQQQLKSNVTTATDAHGTGVAGSLALSAEERCIITDQGLTCMVNVLKGCPNPTPGKIAQEFHDIYLESMSCSKVSEVHEVFGAQVAVPQTASAVSDDFDQLKKKKLQLEIRIAELEMWNRENQLHVYHTDLTSDIKNKND